MSFWDTQQGRAFAEGAYFMLGVAGVLLLACIFMTLLGVQ